MLWLSNWAAWPAATVTAHQPAEDVINVHSTKAFPRPECSPCIPRKFRLAHKCAGIGRRFLMGHLGLLRPLFLFHVHPSVTVKPHSMPSEAWVARPSGLASVSRIGLGRFGHRDRNDDQKSRQSSYSRIYDRLREEEGGRDLKCIHFQGKLSNRECRFQQ